MSENLHINRLMIHSLPSKDMRQLVLLTGARQTGKTTLVKRHYPDLNYINLDAPENRDYLRDLSSDNWSRDVGPAVIDEAQKEPVVFDKIKYAFDGGNLDFSVLLGSSQILLMKKIRESLAGRITIRELWPLMMSELSRRVDAPLLLGELLKAPHIEEVLGRASRRLPMGQDTILKDAENHLLRWGGMPALLHLEDDQQKFQWLKDYEYTYLERDLADLSRLDDLEPFRKFQQLASLRSGCLLNYSELSRDTGISVDTTRRYLEYLRLSYQVIVLQPFFQNITSSVIKTPKIYWLDIGLWRQLSGFRGLMTGEMYETMVVSELFKWIRTTRDETEVYFYRTRGGLEVDVLLKTPNGLVGVEIKGRKKVNERDAKSLRDVASKLGGRWQGGMVVYLGDDMEKIADPGIWAVPSRRLFG